MIPGESGTGTPGPGEGRPAASCEIVIIGSNYTWVLRMVGRVQALSKAITAIHSDEPVAAAESAARRHPAALIVALGPEVKLYDLHPFLRAADRTRCILVVESLPPPHGFRELVTECGGAICALDQPPVVIVATIVAMLAEHDAA